MSAYKSNLNPAFRSKFSEDIFNLKYKHEGAETWDQLASTLVIDVCGEFLQKDDVQRLYEIIRDMKFIPGGRYLAIMLVAQTNSSTIATCYGPRLIPERTGQTCRGRPRVA